MYRENRYEFKSSSKLLQIYRSIQVYNEFSIHTYSVYVLVVLESFKSSTGKIKHHFKESSNKLTFSEKIADETIVVQRIYTYSVNLQFSLFSGEPADLSKITILCPFVHESKPKAYNKKNRVNFES